MCMQSVEILTYPAMLEDPLIHLVMGSDGVTEAELRALMLHTRELIAARGEPIPAAMRAEAAG